MRHAEREHQRDATIPVRASPAQTGSWAAGVQLDVVRALRTFQRAPRFAISVVSTLGIGIAANATMAGTIDKLFLQSPPGVRAPQSVTRLFFRADAVAEGAPNPHSNYPTLVALRAVPALDGIDAFATARVSFGEGATAVAARAMLVTGAFFRTVGATATAGRLISAEDDRLPEGAPVVVLSESFWRRELGADPAVLGRNVRIGRKLYTVVGVVARGFRGVTSLAADIWIPMSAGAAEFAAGSDWASDNGSLWLSLVGRLRPDISHETAALQATVVFRRWQQTLADGDTTLRVIAASIIPGRAPDRPRDVRISLWLGVVSVLVLAIACVNVINLLAGRAIERRTTIAIRLALGANSARIARELFIEAAILALFGGLLAAAVLPFALGEMTRAFVAAGDTTTGVFDLRLLSITAAITSLTAIVVGLAPLLHVRRPELAQWLRGGAGTTAGRSTARLSLLALQAMFSTILLVGAGLFALSLRRVQALDLGVDLDHTIVASVNADGLLLSRERTRALFDNMLGRLDALPSVERAALAESSPYMSGRGIAPFTDERGQQMLWGDGREVPYSTSIGAGFFTTVGARSLRGRDFTSADVEGAELVAVINGPLARVLWPSDDALGKCMHFDTTRTCIRVVGVLAGVWKFSVMQREKMAVFVPIAQQKNGKPGVLFIRAARDPGSTMLDVRRVIQGVRPDMPAARIERMRDYADPEFRPWRLAAEVFAWFGVVALAMAAIGIYGLVDFTVAQRTRELGVRMALGSSRVDLLRTVSERELLSVVAGLASGIVVALLAGRWSGSLLYQTSPRDPAVILVAGLILLVVAAAATVAPLRRALKVDPTTALRAP